MRRQHALHNESLCDHLLHNGQYNDWVVTTGFYSALHFVQHQLFPLTVGGNTYVNFEQYFAAEILNKNLKVSKHKAVLKLISSNLTACYPHYKSLYDMCMFSRYNNYVISPAKAQKARENLTEVKTLCPKP